MHKLYSFGFNAFQQTGNKQEPVISAASVHQHVKTILYTSWDVTIGLDNHDQLFIWGFDFPLLENIAKVCKTKVPICIFGKPDNVMGIIDSQYILLLFTLTSQYTFEGIQHAVYSQESIFMLDLNGRVKQLKAVNDFSIYEDLKLPPVNAIDASDMHVLFLTHSIDAPVYGLGSNRLSQLGVTEVEDIKMPVMIDYFCGFMTTAQQVSCGLFHSAVILHEDVYTFGWSKDGRLGSGNDQDVISIAQFLDEDNQPLEVNAIKVACGSAHTLVLDDQGQVWSCGSNKYAQLGRHTRENEACFYRITSIQEAVDCFAGQWTSFIKAS